MDTNTPAAQPQPPPAMPPVQPPATPNKPGLTEGVWSIVCAVIALAFLPPLFGVIGIILGYRSKKKGQQTLGTVGIAMSVACMVLGMIIGALVNAWLQAHK